MEEGWKLLVVGREVEESERDEEDGKSRRRRCESVVKRRRSESPRRGELTCEEKICEEERREEGIVNESQARVGAPEASMKTEMKNSQALEETFSGRTREDRIRPRVTQSLVGMFLTRKHVVRSCAEWRGGWLRVGRSFSRDRRRGGGGEERN